MHFGYRSHDVACWWVGPALTVMQIDFIYTLSKMYVLKADEPPLRYGTYGLSHARRRRGEAGTKAKARTASRWHWIAHVL